MNAELLPIESRHLKTNPRPHLVILQLGENWLEASPEDGLMRATTHLTAHCLMFAQEVSGAGYRLTTIGMQPLVKDASGALELGAAGESAAVFDLKVLETDLESSQAESAGLAASHNALRAFKVDPTMFWDDREHAQLIEDAFAAIMTFSNGKPEVAALKDAWRRPFKEGVLQGLHDADYDSPYDKLLWSSHFFDPDTKQNFWPAPIRWVYGETAYSQTLKFAHEAAEIYRYNSDEASRDCGYRLGLALHYLSDLTQPMHAANFINAIYSRSGFGGLPTPAWDGRHEEFEKLADVRGPNFRIDPHQVTWNQVDPGTMADLAPLVMEVASNSKRIYINKVKPILDSKVEVDPLFRFKIRNINSQWTAGEVDSILQEAIPAGQLAITKFLILWMRRTLATQGWPALELPSGTSTCGPCYFSFSGRTYLAYGDNVNQLALCPTDNGLIWNSTLPLHSTPSFAEYEDVLYQAMSSVYRDRWSMAVLVGTDPRYMRGVANSTVHIAPNSEHSMCVYKGVIYISWITPDMTMAVATYSLTQGFGTPTILPVRVKGSMSIAGFKEGLYVLWTDQVTNGVFCSQCPIGSPSWGHWQTTRLGGALPTTQSLFGPALIATDTQLYAFYASKMNSGVLYVFNSVDGQSWVGPSPLASSNSYPVKSDLVASPLPTQNRIGWRTGLTAANKMVAQPVGAPRTHVQIPDGAVVQGVSRRECYIVCGYAKFYIPDFAFITRMGMGAWDIRKVPNEVVDALSSMPADGSLVQEEQQAQVWFIAAGAKWRVADPNELNQLTVPRPLQVLRPTQTPSGSLAAIPLAFQRANIAVKISIVPGQPLSDVPLRGWNIFKLVRVDGVVWLNPINILNLSDQDLRILVSASLTAPQSVRQTPISQ